MTFANELMETFVMTLVPLLILVRLFRHGGQKFNWTYCFFSAALTTLLKAIELEWSIPHMTMFLVLTALLGLFILIAIVRHRRRPG